MGQAARRSTLNLAEKVGDPLQFAFYDFTPPNDSIHHPFIMIRVHA